VQTITDALNTTAWGAITDIIGAQDYVAVAPTMDQHALARIYSLAKGGIIRKIAKRALTAGNYWKWKKATHLWKHGG
jgi:hypothetical protein